MSVPLAYFTVILIWSTTPLALQWSAVGAGYSFAVMARMLIGLALSALIIALWRIDFPLHARARRAYLIGGLGLFAAMFATYWGARFIPSGLVSVLFGLTPLFTGALAVRWLREAALTRRKLAGMALALAGLATIFLGGHEFAGRQAVLGIAALLVAVLVYSATLVALKRIGDDSPPLATTAGTLGVASPLFVLAWWWVDGQPPGELPERAAAAIAYLGVFGSVLGFALYYYVIKHLPASRIAVITLITPVVALLLGHLLNGEDIGPRLWLGTAFISLGLLLHEWRQRGLA